MNISVTAERLADARMCDTSVTELGEEINMGAGADRCVAGAGG